MCRVGKTSLMNQYPFDLVVISLVIVLVYKKKSVLHAILRDVSCFGVVFLDVMLLDM